MDLLPLGILSLAIFVLGFSYLAFNKEDKRKKASSKKKVPLEPRFSLFTIISNLIFLQIVLILPWPLIYQKSVNKELAYWTGVSLVSMMVVTIFYWLLVKVEKK